MNLKVLKLSKKHESSYAELIEQCSWAMFYHSLKYRDLLKKTLSPNALDHYFVIVKDKEVIAALPAFICDGKYGKVLNSLPFYGSHGSILLKKNKDKFLKNLLVKYLEEFCKNNDINFVTLIDTPFLCEKNYLKKKFIFQFIDKRIGQINFFPELKSNKDLHETLLNSYHQKTRNIVRKALKSNLKFNHSNDTEVLENLYSLHKKNINRLGGVSKPRKFFNYLSKQFIYDKEYRIYIAKNSKSEIVCAMLLFYFKDTVEYFIPAIDIEWKKEQPLSALIHIAMYDAIKEKKIVKWNWGGTWTTQKGVYHFKSRWGAKDLPYFYYSKIFFDEKKISFITPKELLKSYPFFYTIPFSNFNKT